MQCVIFSKFYSRVTNWRTAVTFFTEPDSYVNKILYIFFLPFTISNNNQQ